MSSDAAAPYPASPPRHRQGAGGGPTGRSRVGAPGAAAGRRSPAAGAEAPTPVGAEPAAALRAGTPATTDAPAVRGARDRATPPLRCARGRP